MAPTGPLADHPLLADAAKLAFQLAAGLCRRDAVSGESCAWLHGFWPCLRLVGLAATPDRHASFYSTALRLIDSGAPQVLVSGAADQGMLACAADALRDRKARITVIDSCDTPLRLNGWYAERAGLDVRTQRSSVLNFVPEATFDLICTHSFFGQFSSAGRPGLVAAWYRQLRPGGRVVTANPLRPSGPDEPNRFTERQAALFREHLEARADWLGGLIGVQRAELRALGERYLRARYGYPVRSDKELAALFEAAGFEIDSLVCEAPAADAPVGCGGPGLRNPDVQYAHLIARRR